MAYCPPSTLPQVTKVPSAVLNYGFDLSPSTGSTCPPNSPWAPPCPTGPVLVPWLASGESVVSLTVTSDGGVPTGTGDVTIVDTTITANSSGVPASLITAWISGGTVGTVYTITFTWVTNSTPIAREDSRSMQITVVANR